MKLSEETFIALFDLKKHGVEIDLTSSKTYKAHWTRKKDDIPPFLGGILRTFRLITIGYRGPTPLTFTETN